ncbi:MAG: hypothetical protein ACJ79S_13700, partial [Gemmatimonadaceae bacterium]
ALIAPPGAPPGAPPAGAGASRAMHPIAPVAAPPVQRFAAPARTPDPVPDPAPAPDDRPRESGRRVAARPRKPNLGYSMAPPRHRRGKLLVGGAVALLAAAAVAFALSGRSAPSPVEPSPRAPVASSAAAPDVATPLPETPAAVAVGTPAPGVPTGPAVAPLPVTRPSEARVASHAPSGDAGEPAEERAAPPPPRALSGLKAIDLGGLSKDVDARTRRHIDDEIRSDTRPATFGQPAPKPR